MITCVVTSAASGLEATRQLTEMAERDRMHQAVGVPVDESPAVVGLPEHEGDAERPVLLRRTSDDAALALAGDEDREVAGDVGLVDLEGGLAGREEGADALEVLLAEVESADGRPPVGDISV